jgi:Ca2+-dependent lipid-binding protein
MDPYVVINTRMQRIRTKTAKGQGKNPKWPDDCMEVDVKYVGDDFNLQIFDEDLTDSDLVCQMTAKLSSLCIGEGLDDWYSVQHEGDECGKIHLKGEWHPKGEELEEATEPPQTPPVMMMNGQPAFHAVKSATMMPAMY